MTRANTAQEVKHVYICGSSGTGKSSTIKDALKKAPRVLVFDPDDEYGELAGFKRIESASEVVELLQSHKNKSIKIAYVGEGKQAFEFICNCAFHWGNCMFIAEEIADVTSPAKAPPAWGRLIRRGRKFGIQIWAVTQRPAEADKTIMANAAIIRVHALGRVNDRKAIAAETECDIELLKKMKPLDWLEFKRSDLSLLAGTLGEKRKIIVRAPYTEN